MLIMIIITTVLISKSIRNVNHCMNNNDSNTDNNINNYEL